MRNTFQRENYIKRATEKGTLDSPETKSMIEYYDGFSDIKAEKEDDPAWAENNLEYDLRSSQWILDKVRGDNVYAQNLYAAMCNNDFQKNDFIIRLADKTWACSWRYAGGIIADMQEKGDYIDWYCSGIRNDTPMEQHEWNNLTAEQQLKYKESQGFVSESVVTDEIRSDLKKLGWLVVNNDTDQYL
jgi:hypothetical protein